MGQVITKLECQFTQQITASLGAPPKPPTRIEKPAVRCLREPAANVCIKRGVTDNTSVRSFTIDNSLHELYSGKRRHFA